ncbi:uncharacterized protein Hap1MRO34_012647 [Clarias gariepinus]
MALMVPDLLLYGDVILESPVHPVTEGNPLTLRCLYRNTNISDSGADFYKDDSVLQKQTTGEITISSVSKSDEGFYHCTHPERGESPKSWVSVRASGFPVVIVALSSTFALFFLMILLIVLVRSKKKKGVEYQTPSAVILDTSQPADGENVYENTNSKTTGKSSKGDETVYSELKQDTNKDAASVPSDVTCVKPELIDLKDPKENPDAVPGPPPLPNDVTCVKPELIKLKELKENPDVAPGPSDVACVKLELIELKDPKENQDAVPGPPPLPNDVTCVKPELIKLKDLKKNSVFTHSVL